MKFYLKGYYGYKNLGDEFLLLGVLSWLAKTTETQGSIEHIVIETNNKKRLSEWLQKNQKYIGMPIENITLVGRQSSYIYNLSYIKVFGGGEVISDARLFPHNGRNYFFKFILTIFHGRFRILGGVGTEKNNGTKRLYKQLLGRAKRIVVREKGSLEITKKYFQNVELHHDFCLDLLSQVVVKNTSEICNSNGITNSNPLQKNILINVNKYIWNNETKKKITDLLQKTPSANFRFIPAEIGSDDLLFPQLQAIIPTIQFYDWTQHSVEDTCTFIKSFDYGLAARLHILLLLQHFNIQFSAIAYQEKVTKMLSDMTN